MRRRRRDWRSGLWFSKVVGSCVAAWSRRCFVLKTIFHGQLQLGLAQAAVAALAALAVVIVAGRRGIHLEKDLAVAMVRGLVQIIAVGSILLLLLRAPSWTSVFLLAAMIVAAGAT